MDSFCLYFMLRWFRIFDGSEMVGCQTFQTTVVQPVSYLLYRIPSVFPVKRVTMKIMHISAFSAVAKLQKLSAITHYTKIWLLLLQYLCRHLFFKSLFFPFLLFRIVQYIEFLYGLRITLGICTSFHVQ